MVSSNLVVADVYSENLCLFSRSSSTKKISNVSKTVIADKPHITIEVWPRPKWPGLKDTWLISTSDLESTKKGPVYQNSLWKEHPKF